MSKSATHQHPGAAGQSGQSITTISLAALGVVYGDIGTSPLYVLKAVFDSENGLPLTEGNVMGIVSLIFWALMIVVSLKYVTLILRADNHGEGGIMALLALATSSVTHRPRLRKGLFLVGAFGAALFYGDGVITPAISVLSAVEGLEVATPLLKPYVLPITLGVLIGLFMLQRRGTGQIGAVFGPVMLVWFAALATTGLLNIHAGPQILGALNPLTAIGFCLHHGWLAFVALGAVVLAVTGGEALYADMGHFGAKPIRIAWYGLVIPALTLNYLGQGALLIAQPQALANPFYLLFPSWALYPAVALATAATVIASQAVISGVFSMSKQAIQLGFLPRLRIEHTSEKAIGQIYIPYLNWMLLVAVLMAVLGFGSSSNLASAYGVAVTATMMIETSLTFFVIRYAWKLPWLLSLFATGFFFMVDGTFFAATALKIPQGGWFPLAIAIAVFTIMTTWHRGRQILGEHLRAAATPLQPFLDSLLAHPPVRVGGTAVFLTGDRDGVPHALLHNLAHNQVLHERVVFLTVTGKDVPFVAEPQRLSVRSLNHNCFHINVNYGFKDQRNLPRALELGDAHGLAFEPFRTSFFLARDIIVPSRGGDMPLWRERLFATMVRNSSSAAEFFKLPPNRVIELGARVEI
ncbi:MAG: potassium transporter Kup [Pseudomonadota bacterium]|nr:potassium transporter Kup [Pseudomonadota bacterium]